MRLEEFRCERAETLAWRCVHGMETADSDQTVKVSSDLFLQTLFSVYGIRPENFWIFDEAISICDEAI